MLTAQCATIALPYAALVEVRETLVSCSHENEVLELTPEAVLNKLRELGEDCCFIAEGLRLPGLPRKLSIQGLVDGGRNAVCHFIDPLFVGEESRERVCLKVSLHVLVTHCSHVLIHWGTPDPYSLYRTQSRLPRVTARH